jgi:hypothetical protein
MSTKADAIGNGLAYLCATFRAEVDSWQVRAYRRALATIPADIIMDAAEHLINQAANGRKFFPLPQAPQWKAACAEVIQTKRQNAFRLGTTGCDHPSFMESYQDAQGLQWTRRCACYQRGKQLMAAAGEPLALPAVMPDEDRES